MDTPLSTKIGNGCHQLNGLNGSKNRLRIQGTAILERDNQPNITATYDYNTAYADEFFEEDVNQLHCFQLNKIALGMTIYKKDEMGKNCLLQENGTGNGTAMVLHKDTSSTEPFLTDVIWSRMDIANPSANRNAYIIKQYYPRVHQRNYTSHVDKCNNFWCGFISCCIIIVLGCFLAFYTNTIYPL